MPYPAAKTSRRKRLPRYATYLVVIRQNLDDTIAGAYTTLTAARNRQRDCLRAPGDPSAKAVMQTWDDSGLIAVAIFGATGDRVEMIDQEGFGDYAEAA